MWFARVIFKPQMTIMALFVDFISIRFNKLLLGALNVFNFFFIKMAYLFISKVK